MRELLYSALVDFLKVELEGPVSSSYCLGANLVFFKKKEKKFVMSDLTKENILIVHTRLLESYPKARCQGKVVRHSTKT